MLKTVKTRRLICSKCGAKTNAACACGVPYEPAGVVAARAVKANPEKSDYAIAKEIGVGQKTVWRARERVKSKDLTGIRRVGRDGKSYPAAKTLSLKVTEETVRVVSPYYRTTSEEKSVRVAEPVYRRAATSDIASKLAQLKRSVSDLTMAVQQGDRVDAFKDDIRAIADQLLRLIADEDRRALN